MLLSTIEYKTSMKQTNWTSSYRSYWNGHDNTINPYCNVWCYASECSQSFLHFVPWYMDGNMHHFCFCKHDWIHCSSQPPQIESKSSCGLCRKTHANCDTCSIPWFQPFLLDNTSNILILLGNPILHYFSNVTLMNEVSVLEMYMKRKQKVFWM